MTLSYSLFILCILIRPLPSAFGKRMRKIQSGGNVSKRRNVTYERDIILLPSSFQGQQTSGKITIPRKERDYLASKSLIGKISIDSSMDEHTIFMEIRDVFKCPMKNNCEFKFTVLQPTGGGSKSLMVPVVSKYFEWTASSIAGKNSKTPIYILANEELKVHA